MVEKTFLLKTHFPQDYSGKGNQVISSRYHVVLTKCHGEKKVTELEQKNIDEIKKYVLKDTPILRSGIKFQNLYDLKKEEESAFGEIPQAVVALCGIGDPAGFKLTLERIGLKGREKFKGLKIITRLMKVATKK